LVFIRETTQPRVLENIIETPEIHGQGRNEQESVKRGKSSTVGLSKKIPRRGEEKKKAELKKEKRDTTSQRGQHKKKKK